MHVFECVRVLEPTVAVRSAPQPPLGLNATSHLQLNNTFGKRVPSLANSKRHADDPSSRAAERSASPTKACMLFQLRAASASELTGHAPHVETHSDRLDFQEHLAAVPGRRALAANLPPPSCTSTARRALPAADPSRPVVHDLHAVPPAMPDIWTDAASDCSWTECPADALPSQISQTSLDQS